jgi:hypothetical protein
LGRKMGVDDLPTGSAQRLARAVTLAWQFE